MFISFEGIDFSGKSTQVNLLKDYFLKKDKQVEIIREPGGTEISEKIRELLLDKKNLEMAIETEILLFSASRSQLVREKIQLLLEKGYYVISDRFHDSTTAYQGYGRGISLEAVASIHKLAIGKTVPDLTFFIDIPVQEAERRKVKELSQHLDRIEISNPDFFERVRNGYLELAKHEKRFKVLNGLLPVMEIHKIIVELVESNEKRNTNE